MTGQSFIKTDYLRTVASCSTARLVIPLFVIPAVAAFVKAPAIPGRVSVYPAVSSARLGLLGARSIERSITSSAVRMSVGIKTTHARIIVAERNAPHANDKGLQDLANVDVGFQSRVVTAASEEHGRIILSPVGSLTGDMDDVRKVADAAAAGATAAFAMGATDLTLHLDESLEQINHPADGSGVYAHAALVAKLGILQRAYVALQAREAAKPKLPPLNTLTLSPSGRQPAADAADAIEAGRILARDIGSGDPERMAPLRLAVLDLLALLVYTHKY